MDRSLTATPVANRTHIGFFGRMNAGKSSLLNALTKQSVSIVSAEAGTTTDVVKKTMEIHGVGPCVLLDTAGFDDTGEVGAKRVAAARKAAQSCDIAVLLFAGDGPWDIERDWLAELQRAGVPTLRVLSRADGRSPAENRALADRIREETGAAPHVVSAVTWEGLDALLAAIIDAAPGAPEERFIMGGLVSEEDLVLLVMPQDPQAPAGRLILPEVQTIREALDRHCLAMCVQLEELPAALRALREPPALIVTDSQVFDSVYALKPEGTRLTSFSVLFAGFKGDIGYYMDSIRAIDSLTEASRVLIAECCTHAPMDEDIGRVKIPRMLRARAGAGLTVDITAGADFPDNIEDYDLIIQCGGCMFNRRFIMSRIRRAREAGIPMTNYGITIAYVKGILDRVDTGRTERK